MKKIILVLTAMVLPTVAQTEMTNQEAIEQRQTAMEDNKAAVKEVKGAMKAKDFAAAEKASAIILSNAEKTVDLFPEGSYEGDTKAKKKIWENLADFQERQEKLMASAGQLKIASQAGDAGALKSAFKAVSKDCKGCHRKYRQIF